MKKILTLLCLAFMLTEAKSQSLRKYNIDDTGCSLYMFCDPGKFAILYSEDSSAIYTAECKADSVFYAVFCVKLKASLPAGDEAENMMISYLDYLKSEFKIKSTAGYGKGHRMDKKPDVRGVIDYWQDEDEDDWKIKAWTDGKFIAVMYILGTGKLDFNAKHDVFLNGFRFPGM
jgi:hypothetical protein